MTGDVKALALYAGQSAGLVSRVLPAGEIVRLMENEAREIIQENSLLMK
jgi:NAD(P)H-dependent flavin oxidoreductase YrpB (nitropropane dioxygenase family)